MKPLLNSSESVAVRNSQRDSINHQSQPSTPSKRVIERLKIRKPVEKGQRRPSCSKHGPYNGPYCPECYERAMSGEPTRKTTQSNKNNPVLQPMSPVW